MVNYGVMGIESSATRAGIYIESASNGKGKYRRCVQKCNHVDASGRMHRTIARCGHTCMFPNTHTHTHLSQPKENASFANIEIGASR